MQGPFHFDTVVVGGGVIGTAIAARLANDREVLLVEKHNILGSETSSRNSEVIHAGIYYNKDSLKAYHCVNGRKLLYRYLQSREISHKKIGKIIVGSRDDEAALSDMFNKAHMNGVENISWISKTSIAEKEPDITADVALFSPDTGIFDSHEFMKSLEADINDQNGTVVVGAAVLQVTCETRSYLLHIQERDCYYFVRCNRLVIAAGHSSLSLINELDCVKFPYVLKNAFAKGTYASVSGKTNFRHLIYPVPEPDGLGIHLTLDTHGNVRFGPDVQWTDTYDTQLGGFDQQKFKAQIMKYWPEVNNRTLTPSYAGSRPKILVDGKVTNDFLIADENLHGAPGLIVMLSIESPGLTSALSIAEYISNLIE